MNHLKLLEELFISLGMSERGQVVQDSFKELTWELFNNWALEFNIKGKKLKVFINEVEFASSKFGDRIRNHPLQLTTGKIYIHRHFRSADTWAPPKMVGFDITCGDSETYATLLVKSVEIGGIVISTPGLSLKKICDELDISREEYSLVDGADLFDETSLIRFVYSPRVSQSLELSTRSSIADHSGALLRSRFGNLVPKKRSVKTAIVTQNEILIDKAVRIKTEKGADKDAINRYKSLMDRSFLRDYESYLFYCLMAGEEHQVLAEEFLQFSFGKEVESIEWRNRVQESMDEEYTSLEKLRLKNKVFQEFEDKHPNTQGSLKKVYKENFSQRLSSQDFTQFFRSSENCFYCGISLGELRQLSMMDEIKTKRRYVKGKSLEIDKKNPNGVYEIDNIVLCCYWCNNAKTDEYTVEEFMPIGQSLRLVWEARLSKKKLVG